MIRKKIFTCSLRDVWESIIHNQICIYFMKNFGNTTLIIWKVLRIFELLLILISMEERYKSYEISEEDDVM